jgi:valyl-tRNA synthetase
VKQASITRALWIFDQALRLLHPVMPFISEELWQHLADRKGLSLMRASFPSADAHYINPRIEEEVGFMMKLIDAVRNIRGELNVPPGKQIEIYFYLHGEIGERIAVNAEYIKGLLGYIERLCKAKAIPSWLQDGQKPEQHKNSASAVVDGTEIFIPLEGIIDLDAERKRLEKEIARLQGLIDGIGRKLENASFIEKAPKDVVEKEREKQRNMTQNVEKLKAGLAAWS